MWKEDLVRSGHRYGLNDFIDDGCGAGVTVIGSLGLVVSLPGLLSTLAECDYDFEGPTKAVRPLGISC